MATAFFDANDLGSDTFLDTINHTMRFGQAVDGAEIDQRARLPFIRYVKMLEPTDDCV